ncbi:MAG: hypothetical protein SFY81_09310 [Verrucomicrobiota bacterium]|nr:hypothetical protein [Verrucomicrobiota bacterium]
MNVQSILKEDLQAHLRLYREILSVVERESHSLKQAESTSSAAFDLFQAKKNLLPVLNDSLDKLRQHRATWLRLDAAERSQHPEIASLLRQNQDLIMKIIVLDRENEQILLRRGMLPSKHLPPANRQRPHFVADLYRRSSPGS